MSLPSHHPPAHESVVCGPVKQSTEGTGIHKSRFLTRAFLAAVVATAGCGKESPKGGGAIGGGAGRPEVRESFRSDSMGVPVAAWIGRSILEKVVDEVAFSIRRAELKNDLQLFEAALTHTDGSLSEKVAALRKEIDGKATAQDVRQIVGAIVSELEAKVSQADAQVAVTEGRAEDVIKILGYVPEVTPSPLLRVNLQGQPEAHPLTVKWARLLSRSYTHRIEMEQLNAIYKLNAPEMQSALQMYQEIQQETVELRKEVKMELAKLLLERTKLFETRRIKHPDIANFDASIASLTWLAKIIQTEEGGRYKGMLVVPNYLVGPAASDILATFALVGADTKTVVPLYEELIPQMPADKDDDLSPLDPETMRTVQAAYVKLLEEANECHIESRNIQAQLNLLLQKRSELHPLVQDLQKKKLVLMKQIADIYRRANALRDEAMATYLEQLKTNRPDQADQKRFTRRIILPLTELRERSSCFDRENNQLMQEAWIRYATPGQYTGREDQYLLYLRQQKAKGKTAEDMSHAEAPIDLRILQGCRQCIKSGTDESRKFVDKNVQDSQSLAKLVSLDLAREDSLGSTLRNLGALGQEALPYLQGKYQAEIRSTPNFAMRIAWTIYRINGSTDNVVEAASRFISADKGDQEYLVKELSFLRLREAVIDPRAFSSPILEKLSTGSLEEKPALLILLGQLGPRVSDLCPIIEDYLTDPVTREAAFDALRSIRSPAPSPK